MIQAIGPIIRFVCEDHPDTPGCDCVQEMVKGHTSARALVDQLKELNLSLQIKLRESQREAGRLRVALAELAHNTEEWVDLGFIVPGERWLGDLLASHGVDLKTLEGDCDADLEPLHRLSNGRWVLTRNEPPDILENYAAPCPYGGQCVGPEMLKGGEE